MRKASTLSTSLCTLAYAAAAYGSSSDPVNKGMVAFGLIPGSARDSVGDTLGGIGSAIAIKRGTFVQQANGSYTGSLIVQPDRGYNVETTVDYQGRQHEISFVLNPYYGSDSLSFSDAQKTLAVSYQKTLLYTERAGKHTSGLDAVAVRPATSVDPQLPVPSVTGDLNKLSLDLEGLALNSDGSFWVSDEYGPYIYRFFGNGTLDIAIQPIQAVLPYADGSLNFTSVDDPDTGRAPNQGFEGLTVSPDGKSLYAMLQSATIQDGGDDDDKSRYARLFQYDVTGTPKLVGEWVVPLPQTSKGKTIAQSEIHYLDGQKFLVLARDGHGHGDDETESNYKSVDIFDISKATNIVGGKYDGLTAVAPKGKLASSITAAKYSSFVSLIDKKQLKKFGLHNGDDADATLIDGKWESIALAPVYDSANPNDYFLFVAADNDFITTNGSMVGQPYSDSYGQTVNNQFIVYRVTLPTVPAGSVAQAIA